MQQKKNPEFDSWQDKHYAFFQNKQCEYFPCHPTDCPGQFNCLFCFCPLYPYPECGGVYTLIRSGIKDCSVCLLPHQRAHYTLVISRLRALQAREENKTK